MALVTVGLNPAIDRVIECLGFRIGGHLPAREVAHLAAGKAANVSRALAALNIDSIATGFSGAGELAFFTEQLVAAGPGRILCRFVEVGGRTRENLSIVDPANKGETHLRAQGFEVTADEIGLLEKKLDHELKEGDTAVFAGSLCGGISPAQFGWMLDRCAAKGVQVAVDCSGEAFREALQGRRLWLVKPNVEELSELVGHPVEDEVGALVVEGRKLAREVDNVVISRGGKGAVMVCREGVYVATHGEKVEVVRTVGCGDHLLGGVVGELTAGRASKRALAVGMALAGARAASAKVEEVEMGAFEALLRAVKVEQVA